MGCGWIVFHNNTCTHSAGHQEMDLSVELILRQWRVVAMVITGFNT